MIPQLADNENAPMQMDWLDCAYLVFWSLVLFVWPGRSHGGNGSAQSDRGSTIGPASDVVSSFHEVPYA